MVVYVAEHVSDAPGARTLTGHVGPDVNAEAGATWVSVTPTFDMLTFPVLVTTKLYVITAPTALTEPGDADFTIDRAGAGVTGIVTVEGGEGGNGVVEPGGVPVTVAESCTDPWSKSAWVVVYVAEHVVDANGANTLTGQVIADSDPFNDGATWVSVTVRLLIVTFPVFVTKKLYGTFWPTVVIADVLEDLTTLNAPATATGTVAVDGPETTGVVDPGGVP